MPCFSPSDDEPLAMSRRAAVFGFGAAALLAGCSRSMDLAEFEIDEFTTGTVRPKISVDRQVTQPELMYASFEDGGFVLPEVPFKKVEPKWRRQIVVDPTGEAPGTIVVRLEERHLYWVQPGGDALRYGVGIGREGFSWQGEGVIQWRQKWPKWTPPAEMIARQPQLARFSAENGGQPPGLDNPLGARALYIFQNGQDTLYRLHGSPEWNSIGRAVSSGCVRLMNQDIIDLYERVPNKARIVVWQ
ncbi:MAG TPA: L,D-transpeptidase [Pseudorhizobium sp.]|nr:L,D-transpeptidase [Pseudorhizobium sp.]